MRSRHRGSELLRFQIPLRARVRLFLAAGSAGLMIGAAAGSAWLGGHLARQAQLQSQAGNLIAFRDSTHRASHLLDAKAPRNASLRRIKQAGFGEADLDRRALALVLRHEAWVSPLETLRLREEGHRQAQLALVQQKQATVRQNHVAPDGSTPVVQASMGIGLLTHKSRPAAPFALKNRSASDLDCLTQAVYYEARGEGEGGMRAVAQVILNRVRHPAYPKTICNVVYQGAERRTGCQFSFTCSGVTGRRVESGAWKRARAVAEAALDGYVARNVGSSTHFHTLEVRPVWRHRMDHIVTVGNHAFYQFPGQGARIVAAADDVRPSSAPAIAPAAPEPEVALVAALDHPPETAAPEAATTAVRLAAPVTGADAKAVLSGLSAKTEVATNGS